MVGIKAFKSTNLHMEDKDLSHLNNIMEDYEDFIASNMEDFKSAQLLHNNVICLSLVWFQNCSYLAEIGFF